MSGITWKVLNDLLSYNPDTGVIIYKVSKAGHVQKGREAGSKHNKGYRHVRIFDRLYLSHRIAWAMFYNERPPEFIDHINGARSDNRIANLRSATDAQNAQNRKTPANNTSGEKGVNWNGKYWVARVRRGKQCLYGGYHTNKEAAISAVRKLRFALHGEYANG